MAKKEEIPTDLTLDIGGDLAPDEFVTAVRNFFGYVREVAEAQEGDGAKIDWTVKVREGSSLTRALEKLTGRGTVKAKAEKGA